MRVILVHTHTHTHTQKYTNTHTHTHTHTQTHTHSEDEQSRLCTSKRTWCNIAVSHEGCMGQPADLSSIGEPPPHITRMPRRRRPGSNSGIASGRNNGSRTEDELRTLKWQKRKRPRSGSRPGQGANNAPRITNDEWKALPVEIDVSRRLLSVTLQQVELKCTSNTGAFCAKRGTLKRRTTQL